MSDLTHAQIGRAFVKQYYTTLYENPSGLWKLYNAYSTFVHGGNDCTGEGDVFYGVEQIAAKLKQLDFHECHTRIIQVDSARTLDNGVVLQVCGEISNRGSPMRRFTQTFVLCPLEARKFYVANDIFRYQDEVFGNSTPSTRRAMIDTAQYAKQRAVNHHQQQQQEALQRLHTVPSSAQPQSAWTSNNNITSNASNSTFGDGRLQEYTEDSMSDAAALSSDIKGNWTFNSAPPAPYDEQNAYGSLKSYIIDIQNQNRFASSRPKLPEKFHTYRDDHQFPLETLEISSTKSATDTNSCAIANKSPQQMMNSAYEHQDERHEHICSLNSSPFAQQSPNRYDSCPDEINKSPSSPLPTMTRNVPCTTQDAPSRSWAAIASCGRANNSANTSSTSPRSKPAVTSSPSAVNAVNNAANTVPANSYATTPIRSSRGAVTSSQVTPSGRSSNTGQRYPEDHQVFVGNVSNTVDEKTLRQLMATYGKVVEVRLAERNIADKPKFAFVVFDSATTADKLIADAAQNPLRLHGKRLNIERRNPTNRSSALSSAPQIYSAGAVRNSAGPATVNTRSSKTSPSSPKDNSRSNRAQRTT